MSQQRKSSPVDPVLSAVLAVVVLSLVGVSGLEAQTTSVTAHKVACVPAGANAVVKVSVANNQPDTTTRFYFRRLNEVVEDLYYVDMYPEGEGEYWAVMPKA